MRTATKVPIECTLVRESISLEGGEVLVSYLGRVNKSIEEIKAQLVMLERVLDLHKKLLNDTQFLLSAIDRLIG